MRLYKPVVIAAGLMLIVTVDHPAQANAGWEASDKVASGRLVFQNHVDQLANPEIPLISDRARAVGLSPDQYVTRQLRAARSPSDAPAEIDGVDRDYLTDLQFMATKEGWSIEEAYVRIGRSPETNILRDALLSTIGDSLSGVVLDRRTATVWVGFVGQPSAKALEVVRGFPGPIQVFADVAFAIGELDDLATEVHERLDKSIPANRFRVRVNERLNVVEVTVADTAASELVGSIHASASRKLAISIDPAIGEIGELQDTKMRGGAKLANCTTGFTVKRIGVSSYGVATAGHCIRTTDTYSNHSGDGGSTTVSKIYGETGPNGDQGVYTSGGFSVVKTFYVNTNVKRTVTARGPTPAIGTYLCHYGKTTGYDCAYVEHVNIQALGSSHMVEMDADVTDGGDSGGPWFSGATAYGIHAGEQGHSIFTPAYLLQNKGYDVYF